MSRTLHQAFRRTPLFSTLTSDELDEVLGIVTPVRLVAGEHLFVTGDAGDAAYLIEAGRVTVSDWLDGTEVHLTQLGPGDVVGELGFLDGRPRSGQVRAIAAVSLLRIDRLGFDAMRQALRPAAAKLCRYMARAVCARLRGTNERLTEVVAGFEGLPAVRTQGTPVPLVQRPQADLDATQRAVERCAIFADLSLSERTLLTRHVHLCGLFMGEALFEEGDLGTSCFVIVSGEVAVYKLMRGEDEHLATLGTGALVGHVALIDNAPRSATCVVGTQRAVMLELTRDEFDVLFRANSPFALKIMFQVVADLVDRLRNATQRLTEASYARSRQSARDAATALVSEGARLHVTADDVRGFHARSLTPG